ncbi:hypothetical protein LAZ67_X000635 [Cordylochernes scorpioides]|uniref:Protein kinase domain-containing protein n=1 Tax=Cordylochernes scorpioides TaxID=51811 RepID=A0ABY6LRS3_9ARAC|nr:hypothetical protein LAZ67_X000635 [Cordylochernes scorpioides]
MLLLVALAPALLFGLWLLSRRYRHTKPKVQGKSISQETAASDITFLNRRLSDHYEHTGDRWEIPRHQLHFLGLLGEGCFGQVWRCELNRGDQPPTLVAVKTLKDSILVGAENATDKERRDLLSELDIMKTLEPHPNVVAMVGCCTDRAPVFVVMEFLALGTLQNYLRNQRRQGVTLTSRDLTAFAHHIARGMAFLAQHGIVHRDLAARNVLVSENKVCKVADFGFARDLKGSLVYERKTEGRLPIRWMAPESLFDNIFTTKSDVWSFGILMWEIVTLGSTPYPGLGAADVMRKVHEGYRLEKPEHCKREVYNLMFYCWYAEPAKRPSFTELVESLDALLLSENDYIQLDRFPDHAYYNLGTTVPGEKV